VEKRAPRFGIHGEDLRLLREAAARPVISELHAYSLRIDRELLPKRDAARATVYLLKNWRALTRYLEDGDLPIDNNRTERSLRGIASGEFIMHLIFKYLKTGTFAARNSADTDDLFVRSP
jgi:hypothetical protein